MLDSDMNADELTEIAAKLFNVPLQSVTSAMKTRANTVMYSVIYGMSCQRLTREQAELAAYADYAWLEERIKYSITGKEHVHFPHVDRARFPSSAPDFQTLPQSEEVNSGTQDRSDG